AEDEPNPPPSSQPVELRFRELHPLAQSKGKAWRLKWRVPMRELNLAEETFHAVVPPEYKADGSWGVVVWCSPFDEGLRIDPAWVEVLAKRKL
ncbi:hypothetical protein NQD73_23485, partial [Escherichia coli]|uniref:hypothetical protein n=1 Tax=Escherichia coli TaxID=562 RepID=UPI00285A406C